MDNGQGSSSSSGSGTVPPPIHSAEVEQLVNKLESLNGQQGSPVFTAFDKFGDDLAVISGDLERMEGMLEKAKDNFLDHAHRLLNYCNTVVLHKFRKLIARHRAVIEMAENVEYLLLTSESVNAVMGGGGTKVEPSSLDCYRPHLCSQYHLIVTEIIRRIQVWRDEVARRLDQLNNSNYN